MTLEEQNKLIDRMNRMAILLGMSYSLCSQLMYFLRYPDMCVMDSAEEWHADLTKNLDKFFYS